MTEKKAEPVYAITESELDDICKIISDDGLPSTAKVISSQIRSRPLSDMCMERNGAQGQQRYWKFPCDNCKHDGNDCPVPQMTTIEEITRFQKSVEITGCKHQLPAFDTAPLQAQPQDAAAGNELVWMTPEEEEKRIREDERRKMFEKVCSECPIKEEIPTGDERCAESCEGCLIRSVYLSTPASPGKASDVLAELERQHSERISELKSWIKIAEINGDEQRKKELLPVLGEVQGWWAALRQVQQE